MACSKYTLTNTGSSIANFSYRRCDDNMWEYQVPLDPSETKNIWLINGSYGTAFSNVILLVNQGAFPPLNATATPTPTPTTTPTVTPTPSVTATQTPTQTNTPSQTATQTQTNTPTNTQTSTQTSTPTPTTTTTLTASQTPTLTQTPTNTPTPFFYSFALGSGDTPNAACFATSTSLYTTRTGSAPIEQGEVLYTNAILTETAPNGYYSNGTNWYQVNSAVNGIPGQVTTVELGGCSTLVTPTPTTTITASATVTPSVTPTNTPTPSVTPSSTPIARYIQSSICHDENSADDACGCASTATIWTNSPIFSASTLFWSDATGPNTAPTGAAGFYALGNILYYVDNNCGSGCSTGSTLGYTTFCNVTPTPTPTQTNTPTLTSTPIQSPTPTQSGTPAVTPTPTSSSFGSNAFKVTMFGTARALANSFTLTESPYIGSSGVGFSATTGTYPLAAGPASVYGTHQALNNSTVTFEINSSGSSSVSIFYFVNGSIVSGLNNSAVTSGPNTKTLFIAGPYSSSDTIEFQIT